MEPGRLHAGLVTGLSLLSGIVAITDFGQAGGGQDWRHEAGVRTTHRPLVECGHAGCERIVHQGSLVFAVVTEKGQPRLWCQGAAKKEAAQPSSSLSGRLQAATLTEFAYLFSTLI